MDVVPLAPEDAAILRLESQVVAGHTCKVVVVDGMLDVDDLRARVATRIGAVPELSRRLVRQGTGWGWQRVDRFDTAAHVVPRPGAADDEAGLRRAVEGLFAERLDRSRPLWRLDVVPVRELGTALVWRVHHALADGTTLMRYAEALLWDARSDTEVARRPTPAAPDAQAADDARRRSHLAGFFRREFTRSARASPFDGCIGSRRSVAFASTDLEPLARSARNLCNATVNDAVLAVVAGGVRRWLSRHHDHLGTLRLKVPVSLHHPGADEANRDSFFVVGVPLHEDPATRLRDAHAATAERKAADDAGTMDELLQGLRGVSPGLARLCARIERSPRSFAVNVSNVPGPRHPVDVLQHPVRALYSLAEIAEHHALRVAVVSLDGKLFFGLCADPDIVDHLDTIAAGIETDCRALAAHPRWS